MPDNARQVAQYHRLGVWREQQGDVIGAVAAFESAADADPTWAARHWRLGKARERAWDLTGAARAYAQAVAIAPHRSAWSRGLASARRAAADFRPFGGLIIAHRGTTRGGPENTREGLEGVPPTAAGVEVDVRLSKDGVPVLMHDARVDRTTDGYGAVAGMSVAELTALRGKRHGAPVPGLAEYLEACGGKGFQQILLDIKSPTARTFEAVTAVVRDSPVRRSCVVLVRGEDQMREFRRISGDLRLGSLGTKVGKVAGYIAAARECRAEVLLLAHGDQQFLENRAAIAPIHEAGLRVGGSIVNSREALEAARIDGCDILLTDRADQLVHFIGDGAMAQG